MGSHRVAGGLEAMSKKSIAKKDFATTVESAAAWRLSKLKPLPNYTLEVWFADGTHGLVEMQDLIMSPKAGVFSKLKDNAIFNQVHIEFGVATWPGEIDLAPDAMHEEIKKHGKWILQN